MTRRGRHHCPWRAHTVGQELPLATAGLWEAGVGGLTHPARQEPGTSSTVQMEAGDLGSGNAVSDPAQASPILHSLGAEPTHRPAGPGSP